jgi:hypothetical protein
MNRKLEGTAGFGFGSLAFLGFLAACAMFIPELRRYLRIKRM